MHAHIDILRRYLVAIVWPCMERRFGRRRFPSLRIGRGPGFVPMYVQGKQGRPAHPNVHVLQSKQSKRHYHVEIDILHMYYYV